jgi:hypothetical protein
MDETNEQREKRAARNKRYYEKKKAFKPSKEDYAERDKNQREELERLSSKYGTKNADCLKFRKLYEEKDHNEFFFQHLESCHECGKWAKNRKFDMNDTRGNFEELRGYAEVFQGSDKPLGQGWQDMTEQNDKDIQDALNPKTKEEKDRLN